MTASTDPATISRIVEVLKENLDPTTRVDIQREAQEWAKRGFTPDGLCYWVWYGYVGFSDIAKVLRDAGLTPIQAGFAISVWGWLLYPGCKYPQKRKFIRRALRFRNFDTGYRM